MRIPRKELINILVKAITLSRETIDHDTLMTWTDYLGKVEKGERLVVIEDQDLSFKQLEDAKINGCIDVRDATAAAIKRQVEAKFPIGTTVWFWRGTCCIQGEVIGYPDFYSSTKLSVRNLIGGVLQVEPFRLEVKPPKVESKL